VSPLSFLNERDRTTPSLGREQAAPADESGVKEVPATRCSFASKPAQSDPLIDELYAERAQFVSERWVLWGN
jgi:hypothetical protein